MSVLRKLPASLLLLALSAGSTHADADDQQPQQGQVVYATSQTIVGSVSQEVVPASDSYVVMPTADHHYECYEESAASLRAGTPRRVWHTLSDCADKIGLWLLLKDRKIKRQTYYPPIPPLCPPQYGYHPTTWRRGFGYEYPHEGEMILPPHTAAPVYEESYPDTAVPPPAPSATPPEPMSSSMSRPINSPPEIIPNQFVRPISAEEPSVKSGNMPRRHLPIESRVLSDSPEAVEVTTETPLRPTGWRPTNPARIRELATSATSSNR